MKRKSDGMLMAGAIGLALMVSACGQAQAEKSKGLGEEVATLKAEIAQLRSQADYQLRLIAGVRAVGFAPGGLCADPCGFDSDGDGANDCEDPCPCDPGNADGDGDGVADCADPCPDDATDACIDPCRHDSDGDALNDCEDPCPFDPSPASDRDGDGIPDCADPCVEDATNDCGVVCPLDADGDGTNDCVDPCPFGASEIRPCAPPPVPPGADVPSRGNVARRSMRPQARD